MAIQKSESAIHRQTLATLRTASDGAEAQLREFLKHFKSELSALSQEEEIVKAAQIFSSVKDVSGSSNITSSLSTLLSPRHSQVLEVEEILVLSLSGRVLASSVHENLGEDFSSFNFFKQRRQSPLFGDVIRDPNTGQPTWIIMSPIIERATRRELAFVAFRVDPFKLTELMTGQRILAEGADTQSFRVGNSGETYIVNRDHLMITESRYLPDSILKRKIESLPIQVASQQGQEFAGEYADYRGMEVTGASILLRNFGWTVITEINFSEAFAPIQRLRHQMFAWTVGLLFFSVLLSWLFASRLLQPIRLLNESDRALTEQDEAGALVPEDGLPNDELGQLVRMRNSRIKVVFDYQRQLEERTAKLQEMINEIEHISYAIVHDMRAPLRAMQGFASILETEWDKQTPEERSKYLRHISMAAIRLDDLIRDVLTYNNAILSDLTFHPVDLEPLLDRVLLTYPNLQSVHSDIIIERPLPVVLGNETLLTQCFSNLLDNAVKFAPPGIKPRIRVWAESIPETLVGQSKALPKRVRIWIEDNGIGIPKEAQSRLFRMFQRFTHDHDGTGVGLALVHKGVARMGGRIGVESELGKGSRFWIELPAAFVENTSVV